ncbi:MAG: hypothetical protein IPJ97_08430 [Proteobacteria bacterium]|nr:hypothetical protein [Pseudomonadota bacterium]
MEKANISLSAPVPLTCRASTPGVRTMKGKGLPAGLPFDRRAGDLDVHDGPLLLRLAPQRKDDRTPAQRLLSAFAREHILEFDITKQRLRFGHEIENHHVTFALSFNDHFLELLVRRHICGMFGLGHGRRNFPVFPGFRRRDLERS